MIAARALLLVSVAAVAAVAARAADPADAAPAPLDPSFTEDLAVRGLRPAPEVKRVVRAARASFAPCARAAGRLTVDVEILAAGFVDHVRLLDPAADAFDAACLTSALQRLPFKDRGKEPASHAVLRFVAGDAPAAPGTAPADIAAVVDESRSDFLRCVENARRRGADKRLAGTAVAHLVLRADGGVARADVDGGTLPSLEARDCIAGVLSRLRFAGGRDVEAQVTVPLVFEKPPPAPPPPSSSPGAAQRRSALEAPTLFQVLGCASPLP